jgi:hypothetical protein
MNAANRAMTLLLVAFIVSCSPREFAGPSSPREWIAVDANTAETGAAASLDWSRLPGVIAAIDGVAMGNDFAKAQLPPGRHVIAYEYHPAEFGAHPQGTIEVALVAGHSYEFRTRLCYWCSPRKHAEWIVDTSTGELACGALPTWPSWYW